LIHAAMRGAVGLLFSLQFQQSKGVSPRSGGLAVFYVSGMVVIYCLNAVTTVPLCKALGLTFDKQSNTYFIQGSNHLLDQTKSILKAMGMTESRAGEFLSSRVKVPANFNPDENGSKSLLEKKLRHKRKRFSSSSRVVYDSLLDAGLISRGSWLLLTEALKNRTANDDASVSGLFECSDILEVAMVRRVRKR
jgi:hypothetical protein